MRASVIVCLVAMVTCCHGWRLIWEDEFDSDRIDCNKWEHEVTAWGGGNGEFQAYIPDKANSYQRDGKLFIKPIPTKDCINPQTGQPFGEDFLYTGTLDLVPMYGKCTQSDNSGCLKRGKDGILPPVMSARLRTKDRFSFKYGRVEVEAKLPGGDWIWPAIWLLPENDEYGGWPRSGEIDIMESIGNRDLKDAAGNFLGAQKFGSTLHWGPVYNDNKYYLTGAHKTNITNNYADSFHLYVMEWNENGFRYLVDGEEFLNIPDPLINENPGWKGFWEFGKPWWSTNVNPWENGSPMAPFDKEYHLLLNVAVGGTNGFIPDGAINQGGRANKPWVNGEADPMQKFWNANSQWGQTWKGEDAAMVLKSIRVYQK